MPALGYKLRFVPLVESGAKPHSFRAGRKRPFKVGDTLFHYYGLRTKACRKIRPDTVCTSAMPMEIDPVKRTVFLLASVGSYYNQRLRLDGMMNAAEIEALAKADGFNDAEEFFQFFRTEHGEHVVRGQLVEWRP